MDYKILNKDEVNKHKKLGNIEVKIGNGNTLPYKDVGNFMSIHDINDFDINIVDFIENIGLFLGIPVYYERDDTIGSDEYTLKISDKIKDVDVIMYYDNINNITLHFNHIKVKRNEFYNEHIVISGLEKKNVILTDFKMNEIVCQHSFNVIFNDDYKKPMLNLKFIDIKNVRIILFDNGEKAILFEC